VVRVKDGRSNVEIIAEVLKASENSAGKTKIMSVANGSYQQLQKHLGFLLQHGFINRLTTENSHFDYRITEKGLKLLKIIDDVLGPRV